MIDVKRELFLSTEALESVETNRKKTTEDNNFSWLTISWIRVQRTDPLSFKFKTTCNSLIDFETVNLDKNKSKRGPNLRNFSNVQQHILYPRRRVVTEAKKKDMLDLLSFIPPTHHQYFKNLPTETSTRSSTNIVTQSESDSKNDEMIFE